jgi:hypothetical protein
MKLAIAFILLLALMLLVRRNLLRIDYFFPLYAAIVLLGFAAVSDQFVDRLADGLGIKYAPLAIILFTIFFVLALVTSLSVLVGRMRRNEISLVRRLAEIELEKQEPSHPNFVSEKRP